MTWRIIQGDCIERMAEMEEASIDAMVCDPPYDLTSKRPGGRSAATEGKIMRGFMGLEWDGSGIAFRVEVWAEALRVLKPGGHLLAFGGTRTCHRLTTAIEAAGFEIRDRIATLVAAGEAVKQFVGSLSPSQLQAFVRCLEDSSPEIGGTLLYLFGSGFPKSHNLHGEWEGFGTALKPAFEPIVMARKPLIGTVAANILEHGTGGINVDGCRIEGVKASGSGTPPLQFGGANSRPFHDTAEPTDANFDTSQGRWPANIVLSHLPGCQAFGPQEQRSPNVAESRMETGAEDPLSSEPGASEQADVPADRPLAKSADSEAELWECAPGCPVADLDSQTGVLTSGFMAAGTECEGIGYQGGLGNRVRNDTHGDSGGASRFFYCAKTSRAERNAGLEGFEEKPASDRFRGERTSTLSDPRMDREKERRPAPNNHPTVKPLGLMRWLVRLVTPPGGTCLDPFLGSGSTGCAAVLEGFDFIGIEREPDYIAIAEARIAFWSQHVGREVEDVLELYSASEKQRKAHADLGQGTLDLEGVA